MAYTQEKKDECFDWIIENIEEGNSLISSLKTNGMPAPETFYKWLNERDFENNLTTEAQEKAKRYACACEARELKMLDEILVIADKQGADVYEKDGIVMTDHNVIQRNKLQIEARQWVLGKLRPEKYGNKTILDGGDNPIQISFVE